MISISIYTFLLFSHYYLCRLTHFDFFNDTATTENYTYLHTLSLHDGLPNSATSLVWLQLRLPSLPAQTKQGSANVFKLMVRAPIALGMLAASAFFMGQFMLFKIGRASCRERVCQYV